MNINIQEQIRIHREKLTQIEQRRGEHPMEQDYPVKLRSYNEQRLASNAAQDYIEWDNQHQRMVRDLKKIYNSKE